MSNEPGVTDEPATWRIRIDDSFRHDGRPYTADDEITVDADLGEYFCKNGWASRLDGDGPAADPVPDDVTLEVQNGQLGHAAEDVGSGD